MSNPEAPNRRSRILIVDDDMTIRLLMRESLEQAGFEVNEAEDGAQAVQRFAETPSEVVLMDVEMPRMDGFTACAALRHFPHGQDTPILMVTGHDDVESVNRAFEVGATDFLPKPINWALLAYRVFYLLRSSRTYQALKAGEARLAKAQQMARLGHWDWNVSEDRWTFSEEVCRLFGFDPGNYPSNREDMVKVIHPVDRDQVNRLFTAALRGEQKYEIEYTLLLPDRTVRVVMEKAEVRYNKQDQPEYVEGTVQDVTERRHAEARIRYLAYYDGLTGLPNRQMFSEQVALALRQARRSKKPVALLFIDIDNFKAINDSLGHGTGDDLLRQVADRLSACVRAGDSIGRPGTANPSVSVFRFGGDEFILLHANLQHEQDASLIARRIMGALSESFLIGGQDFFITVSIGIAVYPSDGDDVKTLLRNADSAMYQAKQKGKNTFEFYTESLTQICLERMNLEAKLRRSIEQGELRLCFQPKLEALSERPTGAEALLRWSTPGLGAVPPSRFIPLAEETGLIIPIGEWVLREAFRQMQAWDAIGLPPVTVAVNVSARQFHYGNLSKAVSDLLDESGLEPQCLELELTESAIMSDVPRAKLMLQELSALGVRLAIDDFGTGYSSLSQLRWLPLHALKIDQSFVRDLPENQDASAIALAIIAMAHSLGLRVVAEGVETATQLAFLREHGCDHVQGFLFSPAVPAREFSKFFAIAGPAMRAPLPVLQEIQ